MRSYLLAAMCLAVLLSSCKRETYTPPYPPAVREKLKIRYVTHRGSWQGPDGFPIEGYTLEVSPVGNFRPVRDYGFEDKWDRPADVMLAVAGEDGRLAIKYYNEVDVYAHGTGRTVVAYEPGRQIADLWFAGDELIILWNKAFDSALYPFLPVTRAGIDVWSPADGSVTRTLDIPCARAYPFLRNTVGDGPTLLSPVCPDKGRVFVNDGRTIALYTIQGRKLDVVYEIQGEIWKCVVKGNRLFLEDRVDAAQDRQPIIPIPESESAVE